MSILKKLLGCLFFLVVLILLWQSFRKIVSFNQEVKYSASEELLYFPKGDKLSLVSLGFDNAAANILWFNTVSYFGKHYREDKRYHWLSHMCNVITDLDPLHREIYEFCGFLIAWEAKDSDAAQKILTKGINNTDYWRFYYIRGMNKIMLKEDEVGAQEDFVTASRYPDAPLFVRRLAAKKIANLQDPQNAINFLQEMIRNSEDPSQRKALEEHLKKAIHEYNIFQIEELVARYIEKNGSAPQEFKMLFKMNPILSSLKDPFGVSYYLSDEGEVESTSEVDRLKFIDKEKKKDD